MQIRLSIILATTFRSTIIRAIASATSQMIDGDELLIVGDSQIAELSDTIYSSSIHLIYCRPGSDWGNLERNVGMQYARGTHLMFLDDDDEFTPAALEAVRNSLIANPDRPHMFRMIDPNGLVLWQTREIKAGNHGTPMFVTPNNHRKLGQWPRNVYEGDFAFCQETLTHYPPDTLVWSKAIIYGCRGWSIGPVHP